MGADALTLQPQRIGTDRTGGSVGGAGVGGSGVGGVGVIGTIMIRKLAGEFNGLPPDSVPPGGIENVIFSVSVMLKRESFKKLTRRIFVASMSVKLETLNTRSLRLLKPIVSFLFDVIPSIMFAVSRTHPSSARMKSIDAEPARMSVSLT